MDSWGCMSEERGMYLSEEFEFQYDNHGYNKSKFGGCEIKPLVNVGSYPLVSNTQGFAKSSFIDIGMSDEIRKSYSISSDPSGEVFSDEIDNDYGNVASAFTRLNNNELSIVDLNLVRDGELTESNVVSSPRVKRSRSTSSFIQFPRCQVLGCNKDLGSYKGYYKRHKVCSEHTRTTRVIVNGTEQRFCQQCSRFHQLAEFDDGRRSCRKRLAVHNKRRRKPQFPSQPGTGMINFSSSHPFSEGLPTSTSPRKLEDWKWPDHIKVEDSTESSNTFFHINGIYANAQDIPVNVKANVTVQSTSTMRDSLILRKTSSALSLLSAQSCTTSSRLLGSALTCPLLNENGNEGSNLKHALNSSQDVFKDMSQNGFHKTEMHLMDANSVDHTLVTPSDGNTVDQHLLDDGILRESGMGNTPLGGGMILDLLQLSSRLHRIEQNKLSTESEAG